jgi:hypothetical protein
VRTHSRTKPAGAQEKRPHEKPHASAAWRPVITVFLAFHIAAILCWCSPFDTALISRGKNLLQPYMVWSGLFQHWKMFSQLRRINDYLTANVTYQDGSSKVWEFPRLEKMGYFDKLIHERWRTFANEYLRDDAQAGLWPDAARHIARLNNRSGNPPVHVALVRNWSDIPPPDPDKSYVPGPPQQFVFFQYNVRPGDLE